VVVGAGQRLRFFIFGRCSQYAADFVLQLLQLLRAGDAGGALAAGVRDGRDGWSKRDLVLLRRRPPLPPSCLLFFPSDRFRGHRAAGHCDSRAPTLCGRVNRRQFADIVPTTARDAIGGHRLHGCTAQQLNIVIQETHVHGAMQSRCTTAHAYKDQKY